MCELLEHHFIIQFKVLEKHLGWSLTFSERFLQSLPSVLLMTHAAFLQTEEKIFALLSLLYMCKLLHETMMACCLLMENHVLMKHLRSQSYLRLSVL